MTAAGDIARRRAEMPDGAREILDARTLASAHRRLAEVLAPGMAVLDVGCGTGAITCGIAGAVAPGGRAVGIDRHARFMVEARRAHADIPNLHFAVGDAYALPVRPVFDVVTAARVLNWLSTPLDALRGMVGAARPGGRIVVLDYNHRKIVWTPHPPASMRAFYAAFLRWRTQAGVDNAIADHLTEMFAAAGLIRVAASAQHEASRRGDPDFDRRVAVWAEVAATRGHQMVADGALTEAQRAAAEAEYRIWIRDHARTQTLYLLAVEGVRPD
jgi:ubiquinone/menaquinone biosynthesis C-methylase UbiE